LLSYRHAVLWNITADACAHFFENDEAKHEAKHRVANQQQPGADGRNEGARLKEHLGVHRHDTLSCNG
jgi:hypothetical protein